MPQEGLSMRKVKEVLRLRFDLGRRHDKIVRSCSIGQSTVHRYIERATNAGLNWPLPEDYDDQRLDALLFPHAPFARLNNSGRASTSPESIASSWVTSM